MEKSEIDVTAEQAQMELTEADRGRLAQDVTRMLDYFEKMREVDVTGLEATTHALVKANRTAADAVQPSRLADDLLERAPELEDRFITIPNVL